jgi:hypothetical protein
MVLPAGILVPWALCAATVLFAAALPVACGCAENARLKNQYKTQEDDREYLIRQLVAAKKDNARLRTELNRTKEEVGGLQAELEEAKIRAALGPGAATASAAEAGAAAAPGGEAASSPSLRQGSGFAGEESAEAAAAGVEAAEAFARHVEATTGLEGTAIVGAGPGLGAGDVATYRDAILRLKRVLDGERRAHRAVRGQLAAELGARTEAEMFLRRAIEDARSEVDKKRTALMLASVGPGPGFRRLSQGGSLTPRAGAAMPAMPAGAGASAAVGRRGSRADIWGSAELEGLVDMYTALTRGDREQILASLLAQEHVLTALQRIAFPQQQQRGGRTGGTPPGSPGWVSHPGSRRNSASGAAGSGVATGEAPGPAGSPAAGGFHAGGASRAGVGAAGGDGRPGWASGSASPAPSPSAAGASASGVSAADSLAAARTFAREVEASARDRVEATYGKEFDATLARRAARHGSSGAGGAGPAAQPQPHSPKGSVPRARVGAGAAAPSAGGGAYPEARLRAVGGGGSSGSSAGSVDGEEAAGLGSGHETFRDAFGALQGKFSASAAAPMAGGGGARGGRLGAGPASPTTVGAGPGRGASFTGSLSGSAAGKSSGVGTGGPPFKASALGKTAGAVLSGK